MEEMMRVNYMFKDKIKNYVEYDYDSTKPDQLIAEATCDYYGYHATIKLYSFGKRDIIGKYNYKKVATYIKNNRTYTYIGYDVSDDDGIMRIIDKNRFDLTLYQLLIVEAADGGYCIYKRRR